MLVKSIDLHEAGLIEKYIELKKNNHDIIFSERQKNRITVIIEKIKTHEGISNERKSIKTF